MASMIHDHCRIPINEIYFPLSMAVKKCKSIVSIGCGTGKYELYLREKLSNYSDTKDVEWILVDPNQQSYDRSAIKIKAHYPTVTHLILEHPELINNCIMLLIWPDVLYRAKDYKNTEYDYEAVKTLCPLDIIALWEEYPDGRAGSAMGKQLHEELMVRKSYYLKGDIRYVSGGCSEQVFNTMVKGILTAYLRIMGNSSLVHKQLITAWIIAACYVAARMYPRVSWFSQQKAEYSVDLLRTIELIVDIPGYTFCF